jgi:hypothetical protein
LPPVRITAYIGLSTFVNIYTARAKTSPERQLSGEYTQANAQVKSQKPERKTDIETITGAGFGFAV